MEPFAVARAKVTPLSLLREERELIVQRAADPTHDSPRYGLDHLKWYLDLSKDWGVVTLTELFKHPPETLLDIGAYYGLLCGAAWRAGWQISAVDEIPIPSFSTLTIDSRNARRAVCNVCVDPLPFPDASFTAVLLNEVLEHLVYAPMLLFREIRRVLVHGGCLYLTTPNPAAISKLIRFARGGNNEPFLRTFFVEDDAYEYGGLTFFKSGREARLWTVAELRQVLPTFKLEVVDHYYYGNTVGDGENVTAEQRAWFRFNKVIRPLVKRNRLMGGGTFIKAQAV
jgi:SAM-dependent methyltransferase